LLIVTGNNTVCPAVAGLGVAVGTGDGVYTAVVGAGAETAVGVGAGEASDTGAVAAGMVVGAAVRGVSGYRRSNCSRSGLRVSNLLAAGQHAIVVVCLLPDNIVEGV
jgi:hypothetical protein